METYNFIYFILTTILIYISTKYVFRKFRNYPPTPSPCLPIIGHLHVLKEPIPQTFAKLATRYGPILSLKFGSRPVLLVSSPEAVEECLSKNDVVFCNRMGGFLAGKYLGYNYTSLSWSPYGNHWNNLRRISAAQLLSSSRLQSLADVRADEVKNLVRRLCQLSTGGNNDVVEMKPLLFDMVMNLMTRMIFGKRFYGVEDDGEAEKFRGVVEGTFKLFNELCIGDMVPYLRWLDWKKERKFKEFKVVKEIVMKEMIEGHKKDIKLNNKDINKVKPMIQVLLELQENEPEYWTDDVIIGTISDLFIGGSDTSVGTMEWVVSLLLNHPEVLKKAQSEIDNQVGFERLLTETDLAHLPYLRSIINETLRMYPPAPLMVPHENSKECLVQGYRVPQGTMLEVNLWAIQNDPKLWAEPDKFKPERFEGVDGHKVGYKFMPFGSGRRSCPGEGLATRILGLAVGSLIHCFEWNRVAENLLDMNKAPGFDLKRLAPLEARLKLRLRMMKLFAEMSM